MNRHSTVIYALGCARGAAMATMTPAQLDTLADEQIMARIASKLGAVPLATESQLASWLMDDEGGWNALSALEGSKKWKKRLKRLRKNLKKVADFAVMPTQGGITGIKKQIKMVKENPKAFLTAALSLATGNPAGLAKAYGTYRQKRADRGQEQAPAEEQAPYPEARYERAYTEPEPSRYAAAEPYYSEPVEGQVKRLPQEGDTPRVVGLNWGGLADSMKKNPVPWALGAATGLYLITRRT